MYACAYIKPSAVCLKRMRRWDCQKARASARERAREREREGEREGGDKGDRDTHRQKDSAPARERLQHIITYLFIRHVSFKVVFYVHHHKIIITQMSPAKKSRATAKERARTREKGGKGGGRERQRVHE